MPELPPTVQESQSHSLSMSSTRRKCTQVCNQNRHLVKWPDSCWIQSACKFIYLVGKLCLSCLNRLRSSSSFTCSVPAWLTLGLSPLKRGPIQLSLISVPEPPPSPTGSRVSVWIATLLRQFAPYQLKGELSCCKVNACKLHRKKV